LVVKSSNAALSVCSFSLHFHSYYISNIIAHINSPKINVKAWNFPKILLNILTKVCQSFSWIEAGKHWKKAIKSEYENSHSAMLTSVTSNWFAWLCERSGEKFQLARFSEGQLDPEVKLSILLSDELSFFLHACVIQQQTTTTIYLYHSL